MADELQPRLDREFRARRRMPELTGALFVFLGLMVVMMAVDVVTGVRVSTEELLTSAVLLAVGAGALLDWRRARTTVTEHGIAVRGPVRERVFAWSDVWRIEAEGRGSARKAYLYTVDGRRFGLHHLDAGPLADPAAESADLVATAVRLGLMPQEVGPAAEEAIRRGVARRTAWRRAGVAYVVVVGVMLVRGAWQIVHGRPEHPFLLDLCLPLLCLLVFFVLFLGLGRLREARALRRVN